MITMMMLEMIVKLMMMFLVMMMMMMIYGSICCWQGLCIDKSWELERGTKAASLLCKSDCSDESADIVLSHMSQ